MPREAFIDRNFSDASLATIAKANEIIAEYQAQGFTLTLRQLYYQFVARGLIPNKQTEYKRLGSVINDGRLAGMIDWEAIEDRTRNVRSVNTWDSPRDILEAVASQYRTDLWATQRTRVEVWIEKDALIGVVEPVCTEYQVPYFACRGYSSQSEQWRAGKRFAQRFREDKQRTVVLHLGDHDPSGIDMTRDNEDRLAMFARREIELRRLALNMDQVEQYDPPPNPAKDTDSRHSGYAARFGNESWELDALDPTVIDGLIRQELVGLIDGAAWAEGVARQDAEKARLKELADQWED